MKVLIKVNKFRVLGYFATFHSSPLFAQFLETFIVTITVRRRASKGIHLEGSADLVEFTHALSARHHGAITPLGVSLKKMLRVQSQQRFAYGGSRHSEPLGQSLFTKTRTHRHVTEKK
jgi:hypothetical protein